MTVSAPSMYQPSGAFESQLKAQVVESMEMNMMDNARFMAERLHAGFPSEVRELSKPVCLLLGACRSSTAKLPFKQSELCGDSCAVACRTTPTCLACVTFGATRHIRHTRF